MKIKYYALYKGDNIIAHGSIYDIAKCTGITMTTIKFYGTASYEKRIERRKERAGAYKLIEVEDDE